LHLLAQDSASSVTTMTASAISVLWFDDEFGTDREASLAPWRRAMQAEHDKGRLRFRTCSKLSELAELLRSGVADDGTRGASTYSLLILDVMLNFEQGENYEQLGFEEELVIKLDAGAQIAGLIRSSKFDDGRPEWLSHYGNVPLMLLSSSPLLRDLVRSVSMTLRHLAS
jgi:hypothetical protein